MPRKRRRLQALPKFAAAAGEQLLAAPRSGEFIALGSGSDGDEGEEASEGSEDDNAMENLEVPMDIDLQNSDLSLHLEPQDGGAPIASSAAADELPSAWAFGRGACAAVGAQRAQWRLKVLRLDEEVRPCILAGWLGQPYGKAGLPGGGKEAEPPLVLLTDTGFQLFTSNTSEALRCSPLLPAGDGAVLAEGDELLVGAEPGRQRAWFGVRGRMLSVEAVRLPLVRQLDAGGPGCQKPATVPCFPFFAVRGKAQVQLYGGPAAESAEAPLGPELFLLAGPPGAGKSAWAAQHAAKRTAEKGRPMVHILGMEWLRRRAAFAARPLRDAGASRTPCEPARQPSQVPHGALVAAPAALRALLGADPSLSDADYYQEGTGWDVQGIEADLRITLSRLGMRAKQSESEVKALAARAFPGHCPVSTARQTLAALLPGLLRSAAERGAAAVADDCHLHLEARQRLESAVVGALGSMAARRDAKWLVVLPPTAAELRERRRGRKGRQALDERDGACLPSRASSRLPVTHLQPMSAQKGALAAFESWLQGAEEPADESGTAKFAFCDPNAGLTEFFESLAMGDEELFYLSTSGHRLL